MIFSNKIIKINNGTNATLWSKDESTLILYLFNKTLKKYEIQLKDKKNCVFLSNHSYKKIIQLDANTICPCSNGFITIKNETES